MFVELAARDVDLNEITKCNIHKYESYYSFFRSLIELIVNLLIPLSYCRPRLIDFNLKRVKTANNFTTYAMHDSIKICQ